MNNEYTQHARTHIHAHDHAHNMAKRSLGIACILTLAILVIELIGGFLSHSLALLSDGAHTLTDVFALALAWFASSQAERPANAHNTFGYHRVGILTALVNAVTLIVVAIFITWEAIQRFQHPEPVTPGIMTAAALISICINLYIGFGLQKDQRSLNVRAAALHVFGDVGASVGVIIASIVLVLTGWTFVDPLLSVAIALYIAYSAWGIVRETTDILLEAAPSNIELSSVVNDIQHIHGVRTIHDLHVWRIANGMITLSCHISVENVTSQESAQILHDVTELLEDTYHIAHVTIQLECRDLNPTCCTGQQLYCCMDQSYRHERAV